MGVLQRLVGAARRLTAEPGDWEAAQERASVRQTGTTPITQVAHRQRCRVSGLIRSAVIGAPGQGHGFEIDLYDGSGSLKVVWLGQRDIPGLTAGRRVIIEGLATVGRDGRCTVMNPRYRLIPLGKKP